MRAAPAVATVVLLVLAGCGSPLGSSTPTLTPAPVPTAPPTLAPGITLDGEVAPGRLATAHRNQLSATSYTLNRTTTVSTDGTVFWQRRRRIRVGRRNRIVSDTAYSTVFLVPITGTQRQQYWSNGTVAYGRTRTFAGNEYVYRTEGPVPLNLTGYRHVRATGRTFDLRIRQRDPLRLTARRVVRPAAVPGPAFVYAPSNVSVTLSVRPDGIVRSIRVEYDAELLTRERNFHVVDRFHVSRIGSTTVERPAWAANVTANATVGGQATGTDTTVDGVTGGGTDGEPSPPVYPPPPAFGGA